MRDDAAARPAGAGLSSPFSRAALGAALLALFGSAPPARAAAATRLVVVLPGQTLLPGIGVVGAPDPVVLRAPIVVQVAAVDDLFHIDPDYTGAVVAPVMPADQPPPGQAGVPRAARLATSISREGAATALTDGSLRLSLNGSAFHEIAIGSPATGDEVCAAIENAVLHPPPALRVSWGQPLGFKCILESFSLRYTLFLNDGTPLRAKLRLTPVDTEVGASLRIDPGFGSAPALRLGAPAPPAGGADAEEFTARRLDPPAPGDHRFSRGVAFFEMHAAWPSAVGAGRTLTVDQGAAAPLPALSDPFDVVQPALSILSATVLGDGNGNITQAQMLFNEPIDPATLPPNPADFALRAAGTPPVAGVLATHTVTDADGYPASQLTIGFGSGLGKTDVTGVELRVGPGAGGLVGAESGTPLDPIAASRAPLIDGAPPVLISAFSQDTDGNGGLDLAQYVFSEGIEFSAGGGVSESGVHAAPAALSIASGSMLRVSAPRLVGNPVADIDLILVDPDDPAAPSIDGGEAIARAIKRAMQSADMSPELAHATVVFDIVTRRFVLRSGAAGPGSSVAVIQLGHPTDPAPLLRLGAANGGLEKPGHAPGMADLDDWIVLSPDGRFNLLEGLDPSDFVIDQNVITIFLNNVPGSGTGTPTFIWRDAGDLGFLADRAAIPNRGPAVNNAGLPPEFDPRELLSEADSSPGPGFTLTRSANPGPLQLDASPSIPPLVGSSAAVATFRWRQTSGPVVALPPGGEVVAIEPLEAGTYQFELEVTVQDATGTPGFNPYVDSDGTLARRLDLTVVPGAAQRAVVLLPGETLIPGRVLHDDAVRGPARVATADVPFAVWVVVTDEFFNITPPPPGAAVRLTTTDPDDIEPPFQPFVGSTAAFLLRPSQAAASLLPEVDDEVLVLFEQGDMHRPYVVGSLWNGEAQAPGAAGPGTLRLTWDADPRAVRWNIYRARASDLADLDRDGLPDLGYGACVTGLDPDPSDTLFEDLETPPVGEAFVYSGTMTLPAFGLLQETSLGVASNDFERPNVAPCP